MTATALTLSQSADETQAFMPIMRIEQAVTRYNALVDFCRQVLKPELDFGTIPGTNKPTLLKPGAEKLNTFFGYTSRTDILERTEDWTGEYHNNEPFFYYLVKCQIWRGDLLVAEGIGSCNSWEKKYRYVNVYPNKATAADKAKGKLISKPGKGGQTYDLYVLANPNIADIVNTLQKMAEKRAYVDATLKATNASDMYTQDLEDLPQFAQTKDEEVIEAEYVKPVSVYSPLPIPPAPVSAYSPPPVPTEAEKATQKACDAARQGFWLCASRFGILPTALDDAQCDAWLSTLLAHPIPVEFTAATWKTLGSGMRAYGRMASANADMLEPAFILRYVQRTWKEVGSLLQMSNGMWQGVIGMIEEEEEQRTASDALAVPELLMILDTTGDASTPVELQTPGAFK